MSAAIQVAFSPGERRVAVVAGGTLSDFALWRPGAPDGVGDLHRGRITAAMPAMAGAFVALADAEGFLPDSEGAKGRPAGTVLGLRVTRASQGGKGPRLTARLTAEEAALVGTGPASLLRRGQDPVRRLAACYPNAPLSVDDPALAAELRADLGERVRIVAAAFDDDLVAQVDALAEPVLDLDGGARLSFWPTPALVAIDVDAGSALGSGGRRSAHDALNRTVLPMLGQQIRLRNLSGGIVVDLAGLSPRNRVRLAPDLSRALSHDPLLPKLLGFTALGFAEIVRARIHPPLHELLAGPLAAGLTALRRIVSESDVTRAHRAALRAAPDVVSALQTDPVALPDLVRRLGQDIMLRSDPSLPRCTWMVEQDNG